METRLPPSNENPGAAATEDSKPQCSNHSARTASLRNAGMCIDGELQLEYSNGCVVATTKAKVADVIKKYMAATLSAESSLALPRPVTTCLTEKSSMVV